MITLIVGLAIGITSTATAVIGAAGQLVGMGIELTGAELEALGNSIGSISKSKYGKACKLRIKYREQAYEAILNEEEV